MAKTDVERAVETIIGKQNGYTTLFQYYDGNQPVVYSTQKLKEVFRDLEENFTSNICAVVIDSVKERISFKGFTCEDKKINTMLSSLVISQDLVNESDETHEAACVIGESFVIVWPYVVDGKDSGMAEIFYNDPRNVHIFYEPGNPRKPRYAAKLWQEDDGFYHLTLYYPDRLEYYKTQNAKDAGSKGGVEANSFKPDTARKGVSEKNKEIAWPKNPYGKIPVFHFRVEKRIVKSDIRNVIPLQNGINKLLADMMIAAEFGAMKMRWIISNSDTSTLKLKPGSILDLPAGMAGEQDTEVGEFSSTELKNYIDGIDSLVGYVSNNTGTPKYYFDPSSDAPSGEALIAMEAPLNKKVQDRIDKFTPVWKEVAAFALQIMGMKVDPNMINVNFANPATIQPKTEWEIISIQAKIIPLEFVLLWHGYSQEEVKNITEAISKAKAEEKANLADVYAEAVKNFNQVPE
jgi:hypothetical protein